MTATKTASKTTKPVAKTAKTAASVAKPGPVTTAPKQQKTLGTMTADEAALDIEYMVVDKATAEEWLERNARNRGLRKGKLAEYRADMLGGNWRNIGDPVRFDTNGSLCDGQHRLMALVRANEIREEEAAKEGKPVEAITIPLLVIRGVAPEDQVVMDTGTKRTAADQLRIAGFPNYPMLAAAAKWMIFWDRKTLYADNTKKFATHSEILRYVDENPELGEIVQRAARLIAGIDMPQGYVATAYYICYRIDPDAADEFFGRLSDGVNLPRGDARLALRKRLTDLRRDRVNLSGEMWLSLVLRTWNAWREGQYVRAMIVHRDGQAIACPVPI